ncbi:Macrolide export ATP-binding/permease protein MacB [Anaerohalosphaera lusitana]|uniref:Macrolide export ATP-binding/permease protein MacB n=1 Tax=Anaerohalosphaera lusitana TaxID=1936003 RepID=A0A1U9NQQ3_9BACT|nr:ABC transporter ATP-binding protein [Anaerohalosphaera lusitana]AQT70262.1 Macrolide export ATP-binding/permease protein MacB [Anaerohalosphaera lusitana]
MSTPRTIDNSVINLQNIRKIYEMGDQQVRALDGVDVAFEPGSFWAIMGPSGSGKSTMLNILGCLDRPTSGSYHLHQEDVSRMDDDHLSEIRLKHLGFIFQSFNLIPQLSVQRNIELPLFYLGWDEKESRERSVELAHKVGLEGRLNHRPAELSGGQRQRVAIARALANDPKILLADEPTGNLDSVTGAQILELLDELYQNGKTVIMVTHESEIAAHARKILHMRDGKVQKIEDTA